MEQSSEQGSALRWMLVIFVLAFISIGLWYYYQKYVKSETTEPSSTPTLPTNSSIPPFKTSDWETYTNTKYNYLIKYPPDWTVIFQEASPPVPSNQSQSINLANFKPKLPIFNFDPGQIMISLNTQDVAKVLCETDPNNFKNVKGVSIDGIKAIEYNGLEQANNNKDDRQITRFTKNNICFDLSLSPAYPDNESLTKYHQILSTLKFTTALNKDSDLTKIFSDTTTFYQNQKIQYSVNYPSSWMGEVDKKFIYFVDNNKKYGLTFVFGTGNAPPFDRMQAEQIYFGGKKFNKRAWIKNEKITQITYVVNEYPAPFKAVEATLPSISNPQDYIDLYEQILNTIKFNYHP